MRSLLLLAAAIAVGCGSANTAGDDDDDDVTLPDAGPRVCDSPLAAETLDQLATSILGQPGIQPGETRTLQLGVVECCYFFEPVDACAVWSVRDGDPAAIDPDTGRLSVDGDAANGDVIVATANVENGRRLVTTDLHVYTSDANPLYGIWRETAQLACGSGVEVAPADSINELWFRADGTVDVTWYPFEIYVDYWGTYAYDLASGALTLAVTGGNYVPDDIDPAGTFSFDGAGRLILRDMFLGSYQDGAAPAACGHVFER